MLVGQKTWLRRSIPSDSNAFDTIGFAGGCIWDKGNRLGTVIHETRAGMERLAKASKALSKQHPFGFGVLLLADSQMVLLLADSQMEYSGQVASHQVRYR